MENLVDNNFSINEEFSSAGLGTPDNTTFSFSYLGGTSFQYTGTALDDGVSLFFVNINDIFSEENILGGEFIEIKFGDIYSEPMNSFLGTRTPALGGGPEFGYPPAYGWGEFENNGFGELTLVDHAVVYNGSGIVVNTTIPIPEPNSVILIFGAALFVLKVRSR